MIPEALGITMGLAAGCEYWRSRRGPLVLLALAALHTRAVLLTARREIGRVPERWAREYGFALRDVREWK